MSELKNFFVLIFYLYFLNIIHNEHNTLIFFAIIFITIIYYIKYTKLLKHFANINKIINLKLEKQREFFINILNHDIRIPIIAQIRAIQLIHNNEIGNLNTIQKDLFYQIENSCKTALNITSLIINTYNIENSYQKLNYEKFNLSELIILSFRELSEEAAEKDIFLEHKSGNIPVYINADKEEIKKVLLNILLSAITFANKGDIIFVKSLIYGKNIRISFFIKGSYYKSDFCTNSNYASVGQNIRMFFCKKIIEFHKGHILTKNKVPNSFSFEIPQGINV